MRMLSIAAAALLGIGLAIGGLPAQAQDYTHGALSINDPWARASAGPARAGAAFMTLSNSGTEDDRLLSASAEVSEAVELHSHMMQDGVMRMRPVEGGIVVPAGGTADLAPGGLHVMFLGLKAPFKEGERFPLTLTFENAGSITVEVAVQGVASMGPGAGAGHGAGHGGGHGAGGHGHGQ